MKRERDYPPERLKQLTIDGHRKLWYQKTTGDGLLAFSLCHDQMLFTCNLGFFEIRDFDSDLYLYQLHAVK